MIRNLRRKMRQMDERRLLASNAVDIGINYFKQFPPLLWLSPISFSQVLVKIFSIVSLVICTSRSPGESINFMFEDNKGCTQ